MLDSETRDKLQVIYASLNKVNGNDAACGSMQGNNKLSLFGSLGELGV